MLLNSTVLWLTATGAGSGIITGLIIIIWQYRKKSSKEQYRGYNTSFVFSGNLKQTTLLDAIQFLEIGRREGILHVFSGRRKGYLTFVKGQVVDAFYRNEEGREAIFGMLELLEGDFYFEPKVISQPRLISESMMDIAFEWDARKNGAYQD
jgi:hypothetical protein